jgi:carboxyl-terminal processing protease
LLRGDRIVAVDGVDLVNGSNTNALNAGLSPAKVDESHTFGVRNAGGTRTVTMVSDEVTSTPVHTVEVIPTDRGPVGYMLFNDHIATAEDGLIEAVETLDAANVQDLVLDLRYNGGGLLEIASQLSYMIAGSSRTAGETFEKTIWNAKHTTTDPVTGEQLEPTPFYDRTRNFSRPAGQALPTLDLNRVYILTSGGTCSASEAIINGLRGVDVEVIQIGTTTCGKPYGFYAFDNCGTTYFSVQFKGVNAKNFGDFTDGFSPANTQAARGEPVPGCAVLDDIDHQLGDANERMLSVALAHRATGACALPPPGQSKTDRATGTEGQIIRPAYREIRVMRPPSPTP